MKEWRYERAEKQRGGKENGMKNKGHGMQREGKLNGYKRKYIENQR